MRTVPACILWAVIGAASACTPSAGSGIADVPRARGAEIQIDTTRLPRSEAIGGCLIIYLVDTASATDLYGPCSAQSLTGIPGATGFQQRIAPELVPVALNAIVGAVQAYCGVSTNCLPASTRLRLYVVPDALPNAWSDSGRVRNTLTINVAVTTSLVTVVSSVAHTVTLDAIAAEQHHRSDLGLDTWLDSLDAHAAGPCRDSVAIPSTAVPHLTVDQITAEYRLLVITYEFLLAHELAHLIVGPTCGAISAGARAEAACDSIAIDRMMRTNNTTAAPLPAITLVAIRHYDAIAAPFSRIGEHASGYDAFFALRDWLPRATAINREWLRDCASQGGSAACIGGKATASWVQHFIARPVHATCIARGADNQSHSLTTRPQASVAHARHRPSKPYSMTDG